MISNATGNTSYNFMLGKVVAIYAVAAAHFLPLPGDWIAASVGLFVFGFSSGFFTSAKYQDDFQLGRFWWKKLTRLGPDLLVINLFLLVLFLAQGKSGIWTWQTLTSLLGVKGFLTWFGLKNPSPFGAGIWFLTLLLIFYAVYPLLRFVAQIARGDRRVNTRRTAGAIRAKQLHPHGPRIFGSRLGASCSASARNGLT